MAESFIRTERVVPKDINEVTKPLPFSPFYIRELESFLADQAKEGFMLKEISANNVSFTFEKVTPREVTFRLLLGPSMLDASLKYSLKQTGWKYLASTNKSWFEKDVVYHFFVAEGISTNDDWFWRNNVNYASLKTARSNFYLPILLNLAVITLASFVLRNFPPLQSKSSDSYFVGALIAAFVVDLIQKYQDVQYQKDFLKAMEPQNYLKRYEKADWKKRKTKSSWYGLKGVSTMLMTVLITFLLRLFFEI